MVSGDLTPSVLKPVVLALGQEVGHVTVPHRVMVVRIVKDLRQGHPDAGLHPVPVILDVR